MENISIHAPQTRCDSTKLNHMTRTQISIHAPQTRCDTSRYRFNHHSFISIHAPQTRCDCGSDLRDFLPGYFNPRTSNEVRRISSSKSTFFPHFNPRTSNEVRPSPLVSAITRVKFQSTHLKRGATFHTVTRHWRATISIHAPQTRCDVLQFHCCWSHLFQSTHLKRGATRCQCSSLCVLYFNPRTSNEVRHRLKLHQLIRFNFNPRTSNEVRQGYHGGNDGNGRFQSTHLKRGATSSPWRLVAKGNFNPRTSNEVRQSSNLAIRCFSHFNPRTSNEVRLFTDRLMQPLGNFNPRTSNEVRRKRLMQTRLDSDFNPRTSNEVRLDALRMITRADRFQSTHLKRGATGDVMNVTASVIISIHAPQTRCDFRHKLLDHQFFYFNPRTSNEVRRYR